MYRRLAIGIQLLVFRAARLAVLTPVLGVEVLADRLKLPVVSPFRIHSPHISSLVAAEARRLLQRLATLTTVNPVAWCPLCPEPYPLITRNVEASPTKAWASLSKAAA